MKISNKPFFSIIIPCFNEEKYLPLLLEDLSCQTNQDFEVIVIDGKSSDKTVIKAKKYINTLPLTLLSVQKGNVCIQRNLGAEAAHAEWLLFMDADNRLPDFFIQGLRYQVDKVHPDFFTTFIEPDGHQPLDIAFAQIMNTFFKTQSKIKEPYMLESMLGIKREIFSKVKGFNTKIVWSEGGDLLKRLTKKGFQHTILKEPKYVYSYRRMKKEGALKALRNSLYLILAHQMGIKLTNKTFKKYYPMLGGSPLNKNKKPTNSIEGILLELVNSQDLNKIIDKLNQPISLPKNPLKTLIRKIKSH